MNFLVILQNKENLPIYFASHLLRWKWTKYSEKKHLNLRRVKKLKIMGTRKRLRDPETMAHFTVRRKAGERGSQALGRGGQHVSGSTMEGRRRRMRTRTRKRSMRRRKRRML